jgi:hypothetical protein
MCILDITIWWISLYHHSLHWDPTHDFQIFHCLKWAAIDPCITSHPTATVSSECHWITMMICFHYLIMQYIEGKARVV